MNINIKSERKVSKKKVVEVPLGAREEFLLKKEYINRNTVYIGYKDQIHKNNKALIRTVIMRFYNRKTCIIRC